ncbi:hypothetical protein [Synechocystis sp. LEGE 06083]|nr:hypothetical protein [Synechocystis sp. LEGE 06083]
MGSIHGAVKYKPHRKPGFSRADFPSYYPDFSASDNTFPLAID